MKRFHQTRSAIGIDVGSRSVKAVQLQVHRGRYTTAAIAVISRTAPDQELSDDEILDLGRVLKRQGFQGRDIILAAQDETLLRGVFDLPRQVSGAPVAQIARMELARIHQVQPDSFEMVCWEPPTAGQSKSTMQAIAIGCPHEAANALLDQFDNNGFNVRSLDVRGAAAARACAPLILTPPAITALLDLEWRATQLQLVCGGSVIYERLLANKGLSDLGSRLGERFDLGAKSVLQILNTMGLGATPETEALDERSVAAIHGISQSHFEAVLEELQAPFTYAAHQYPEGGVQRVLLTGEGARLAGLQEHLRTGLGIEVVTAAPSDVLESGPHVLAKANNPAATVALGLAKFTGA